MLCMISATWARTPKRSSALASWSSQASHRERPSGTSSTRYSQPSSTKLATMAGTPGCSMACSRAASQPRLGHGGRDGMTAVGIMAPAALPKLTSNDGSRSSSVLSSPPGASSSTGRGLGDLRQLLLEDDDGDRLALLGVVESAVALDRAALADEGEGLEALLQAFGRQAGRRRVGAVAAGQGRRR